MHWTAVTGETENHLRKRNTCILIFTKLSTLANIVLRDSNFILGEKREKVVNMSWQKKLSWLQRQSTLLVLKAKRWRGKEKYCVLMFLFIRPVSKTIRIRKFKLGFKREDVNFLLSSFPVIEVWQVTSCYTCTDPVTQVLLNQFIYVTETKRATEWGSKRVNAFFPHSVAVKKKKIVWTIF